MVDLLRANMGDVSWLARQLWRRIHELPAGHARSCGIAAGRRLAGRASVPHVWSSSGRTTYCVQVRQEAGALLPCRLV
jgi:hypothetical protein